MGRLRAADAVVDEQTTTKRKALSAGVPSLLFMSTNTASSLPTRSVAGQEVWLTLWFTNVSDHDVAPSFAGQNTIEIVCAADMTADGHTDVDLLADHNFIYVTLPPIPPGGTGGAGPHVAPR